MHTLFHVFKDMYAITHYNMDFAVNKTSSLWNTRVFKQIEFIIYGQPCNTEF